MQRSVLKAVAVAALLAGGLGACGNLAANRVVEMDGDRVVMAYLNGVSSPAQAQTLAAPYCAARDDKAAVATGATPIALDSVWDWTAVTFTCQ